MYNSLSHLPFCVSFHLAASCHLGFHSTSPPPTSTYKNINSIKDILSNLLFCCRYYFFVIFSIRCMHFKFTYFVQLQFQFQLLVVSVQLQLLVFAVQLLVFAVQLQFFVFAAQFQLLENKI